MIHEAHDPLPHRVFPISFTGLLIILLLALGNGRTPAGDAPPADAKPVPPQPIQPAPAHERLGPGVEFIREVRLKPRPLVIAIVEIDLKQPGLEFVVTPGDLSGGRELRALKTSRFLTKNNLRLAVNAGFFEPFKAATPADFYPHEGDSVNVHGLCAFRGVVYSEDEDRYSSLNISPKGEVSIIDDPARAYTAVSGRPLNLDAKTPPSDLAIHPRTAVALDQDRHKLILMVVDGRQPGYSEGVTLAELAGLLAGRGGDLALNLDGGGSATMACSDADGTVRLLNRPIHLGVPGRERPVANHFGLTWK